jgi:hypothetical protein
MRCSTLLEFLSLGIREGEWVCRFEGVVLVQSGAQIICAPDATLPTALGP